MSEASPSNDTSQSGKVHFLIEKWGGWAALALISLLGYMYQGDRANTQQSISAVEKSIETNARAINRLQDGKVSREEFKSVQEQWIRETVGLRQDIRDLAGVLRVDVKGSSNGR